MATVAEATADFLAQKRIAVAGVSRNAGGHSGNAVYDRLASRGYEVYAVNPNADEIDGKPCFRSLAAIPGGVDAVVIATAPDAASDVIADCERLGITARLDAPLVRRRERVRGGRGGRSQGRHDGHRRRLPPDVRAHRGRRPQVHALGARVHLGQADDRLTLLPAAWRHRPEGSARSAGCREFATMPRVTPLQRLDAFASRYCSSWLMATSAIRLVVRRW